MFAFQDRRGAVDVAFTDRHGGLSDGPFASLNLGQSAGDDDTATEENIRLVIEAFAGTTLARAAPPTVVRMRQVHGAHVVVARKAGARGAIPQGDGLVTREAGVVLMVRAADCAPILLTDAERGVVGAAHAGRQGLVAGIVAATVRRMRDLGARRITGWVGPHVCGRCYEVPGSLREQVAMTVPEAYAETSWGTPAVDIGAGVRAQLEAHDVETTEVARCTVEDEDLFSYRRQGRESGRLAGLVWVQP